MSSLGALLDLRIGPDGSLVGWGAESWDPLEERGVAPFELNGGADLTTNSALTAWHFYKTFADREATVKGLGHIACVVPTVSYHRSSSDTSHAWCRPFHVVVRHPVKGLGHIACVVLTDRFMPSFAVRRPEPRTPTGREEGRGEMREGPTTPRPVKCSCWAVLLLSYHTSGLLLFLARCALAARRVTMCRSRGLAGSSAIVTAAPTKALALTHKHRPRRRCRLGYGARGRLCMAKFNKSFVMVVCFVSSRCDALRPMMSIVLHESIFGSSTGRLGGHLDGIICITAQHGARARR